MNALLLLKLINLEQVGIRFVVAVGLESTKAEMFVRVRRSRGDRRTTATHCLLDIESLFADRASVSNLVRREIKKKGEKPFAGRNRTQVRDRA